MKRISTLIALSLLLGGAAEAQSEGKYAAPISAKTWFGWIGEEPRLEAFEGRAVLLHFFVCEKPRLSNWLGMIRIQREFGAKGLQVLAVTSDGAGTVSALLDEFPLPFPVGAGSGMAADWGMGKYGQVLIDAKGVVFYRANASNAVWDGKIIKAIRNTKRLGTRAHLRLTPEDEQPKKLKAAVDFLAQGQLAKADAAFEKIITGKNSKSEELAAAAVLREGLKVHVARLQRLIGGEIARGRVLLARRALQVLVEDLKKISMGEQPRETLSVLDKDEAHLEEVEAAETLAGIVDAFFRRGWEKNEDRWERLLKEYPTTHAAEVTRRFWLPRPW